MKPDISLPAVGNLDFVETLYADYLKDPASVPAEWQAYFASVDDGEPASGNFKPGPSFKRQSIFGAVGATGGTTEVGHDEHLMLMQNRLDRLIRAYRERGHIHAKIDPLDMNARYIPELDPQYYGFGDADMDKLFVCESMYPKGRLPLGKIISRLREIYCGSIGFQYLHIDDGKMRRWLQKRIESQTYWESVSRERQLRILTRLTDAVVFEQFIRKKFVGAKSFSLEGGESLIPLLDLAIERASRDGVKQIVLGMAHRGRLNVLANIMGKSPKQIFREFEDRDPELYMNGGDVKYHLGYSGEYKTSSGKNMHLSLCFNPSHLEFVNPVVMGRVRAKQERISDKDGEQVMSLLIHGDAAFIGEGIVQESLNLARLPGYRVGGTIHIIVNNQIGFTTSPSEGRSTMYSTSVAKMLPAPILHVNGEDPDAVARCIQLAMDFRRTFKQDVVIDMYCYRRLGHNEGDEPSFTQPQLYAKIEQRKPVREGYLEHLLKLGEVTQEEADQIAQKQQELLEKNLSEARSSVKGTLPNTLERLWQGFAGGVEPADDKPETSLPKEKLSGLLDKLCVVPKDFTLHPKLEKFMDNRRKMARGETPLDWSAGEALALASLTIEGHRIRLSGQDSQRGTFSHRHSMLHDYQSGARYMPLQNLTEKQGPMEIINSPISEAGVLGFEYGYSLDCPDGLVLWEAQFGDFVNVAQVILDQFITSGEDKWRRLSGLVMLLPHGFEGSGPEHSSGRPERFLAQAAEDNIQVIFPTTPAQYFHLLRQQMLRRWRKPLVVFTPKGLLRDARAVSSLADCVKGRFQQILPDPRGVAMKSIKRVLLCSGKIYYDLETERAKLKRDDVAIIRLEQLYPFPRAELKKLLADCPPNVKVFWVQDEPENMGASRYLRVSDAIPLPFTSICRPASASPATGSHTAHHMQQDELFKQAFAEDAPVLPQTDKNISNKRQLAKQT